MASKSKKKDLAGLLGEEQASPVLRRGHGLRLSTESPTDEVVPTKKSHAPPRSGSRASEQTASSSEPKRVSRGYKLRVDLVKACKRLALEEDRNLYEIMEEALEDYLSRKSRGPR
jgi:hypothetical protein